MRKLVGLSVSFCVQDICEGRVNLEDVEFIIPGFTLNDRNTIMDVWERYKEVYWRKYPENARVVCLSLRFRPDLEKANICDGHWMTVEDFDPQTYQTGPRISRDEL